MLFFLPYKIDRPFRTPWVTIGIIGACVLAFAWQLQVGPNGFAPLMFRTNAAGIVTWFSAMFLHGGLGHLLSNMYFLWLFGSVVEDTVGRWRYAAIYVIGGLVSALSHAVVMHAFAPQYADVPLLGASGAIAAIFGVFAVRFRFNRIRMIYGLVLWYGRASVSSAVGFALYAVPWVLGGLEILGGANTGVADWAHLGGVGFGLGAAFLLGLNQEAVEEREIAQASLAQDAGVHVAPGYNRVGGASADPAAKARRAVANLDVSPTAGAELGSAMSQLLGDLRLSEAVELYRSLLSRPAAPTFPPSVLVRLGDAAEKSGDSEVAAHAYYAVVSAAPEAQEAERALFRLAHIYLSQGHPERAQATWRAFLARYPVSPWTPYANAALTGVFAPSAEIAPA